MKIGILNKIKKRRKLIVILAVLIVAGVGFSAFLQRNSNDTAGAIKTQITTLKRTNLKDSVSVSGTVKSKTSKNVYTTLTYPIKEIKADVGDKVKQGDVLAVLDTSSISKDVESAEYTAESTEENNRLSLEKAKSDYDNQLYQYNNDLNNDLINAKATIKSAETDLEKEKSTYNYDKYLNSVGQLSKYDLDQEAAKVQSLQIAYNKAADTLDSTQNKVQQDLKTAKNAYETALAKYNDKSNQIALEKQEKNLKDSTIVSPIDGTITVKDAIVGSIPNGMLFTIEDPTNLIVDAEVKEFDIGDVAVGKKVEIKTDATGDQRISGVVSRIAPAATDSTQGTSNVTFTTEVKINGNNSKVKAGMTARLNIILAEKNKVYAVPFDSVLHKADGSAYVFIAEKDKDGKTYKAKEVSIKTGLESDISIEISGQSLSDGIQVVSNPDNITAGSILHL